jgi:sugar transferase (PEP-CTERM system associated)
MAALIRFDMSHESALIEMGPITPRAAVLAFCVLFGLLIVGLYRARQRPRHSEMLVRVILALAIAGLFSILIFFLIPVLNTGRGVLGMSLVISFIGLWLGRLCTLPLMDRNPIKKRVVVFGAGQTAQIIGRLRRRSDRRQFEIIGYVVSDEQEKVSAKLHQLRPTISSADFDEHLSAVLAIDEIVIALDNRRENFPAEQLLKIKEQGVPIIDIMSFLERETAKTDLDLLTPAQLIYAPSAFTKLHYTWTKRIFDIFVATTIFLITLPIFALVIMCLWLSEGPRAPILYRQQRTGRRGIPFQLLKFRSMRVNAEAESGPMWSAQDDRRITLLGKLMRRFRIDELPQLLNIIRGEMSIVGPRPERPEFVEMLESEIPLFQHRHAMRPGLTGWAQLNYPYGASITDAKAKLSYDLYYVKHSSFLLDILISLQTIEVVIWGKAVSMAGSVRTNDLPQSTLKRRQDLPAISDLQPTANEKSLAKSVN